MKKITPIIMFLVVAFVMSSCSKEKKIARSLYKKDGKWNVIQYKYEETTNGVLSYTAVALNTGTMDFSKVGDVTWINTINGQTDVYTGTWGNSDDEITMSLNGFDIIFEIEERSKKELTLKNTFVYSNGNDIMNDIFTLVIKKD